ncbi:MAG: beta-galactosidase, partial [Lachnospiraceae bacterium]|nr:beta-galactosidase [Lachnospiraceae bacterium]
MQYLKNTDGREIVCFNSGWKFCHTKSGKMDEGEEREVELPHDWSLEYPFDENAASCGSGGYVETGIGFYRKCFRIAPGIVEKKDIYIRFEGVYMAADVSINGVHVKRHIYGYTPFLIRINEYLYKDGRENEISVRVDNSAQPNSRWYSGSGITRNVLLMALNKVHIAEYGVCVRTRMSGEGAVISVETDTEGSLNDRTGICVEMFESGSVCLNNDTSEGKDNDKEGKRVYKGKLTRLKDNTRREEFIILDPHMWDINDPFIYTVRVSLYEDDKVIDTVDVRTGIRTTDFDRDRGFSLNGRRVKINGVCVHHDGGCLGAAVPPEVWERRLLRLKDMGANAVRMAHNPPDKEILDICDDIGLMVMDEAFDEWGHMKSKDLGSNTNESRGYSEYYEECHEEDLVTMLKRDRNHPSIILWSIGNEVPDQTSEDGYKTVKHLKEIVNKYDPSRPITQANDNIEAEPDKAKDEFLDELSVVGYNYVGRWRERAETLYGDDKIKHPDRCVIGTENTGIGGIRDEYQTETEEYAGWRTYPYFYAPVIVGRLLRYTMVHDFVSGDFMWTGIDYLGEAHWPSRSSCAGVLDTCGYKKDGYYFYQSIWRDDIPVVHLLPNWNIDACKGE